MKLCVIPARGGSKRLPRKNILPFHGRPMIAYSIAAARESGRFDRIVVSSEDQEILRIAEQEGAKPNHRPESLAGDSIGVVAVLLELLDRETAAGRAPDLLACLYPAAPLRRSNDVRGVVDLVEPGITDFAMAVTDYDLPPHQALRVADNGDLSPRWPELITQRDSAIGPLVVDNGSTYAVSVPAFRRHGTFYGPGLRGHHMPRNRSVDINTADDLALADFFFRQVAA